MSLGQDTRPGLGESEIHSATRGNTRRNRHTKGVRGPNGPLEEPSPPNPITKSNSYPPFRTEDSQVPSRLSLGVPVHGHRTCPAKGRGGTGDSRGRHETRPVSFTDMELLLPRSLLGHLGVPDGDPTKSPFRGSYPVETPQGGRPVPSRNGDRYPVEDP